MVVLYCGAPMIFTMFADIFLVSYHARTFIHHIYVYLFFCHVVA